MPADVLLYAVIAAGLVFWLRGLLGTRSGDERERPNPFTSLQNLTPTEPGGAGAPVPVLQGVNAATQLITMREKLGRSMEVEGDAAVRGLVEIIEAEREFDLAFFMTGAQDAFVMIVEAFAAGERETLEGLLAPALYDAFEKEIAAREKRGESASMEIHAVRKTALVDAAIRNKIAYITVRFTADETSVTYDKDKKVIAGNPDKVSETVDIWTFGRKLRARDPAWLVYETRAAEEDTDPQSNVPEGKH